MLSAPIDHRPARDVRAIRVVQSVVEVEASFRLHDTAAVEQRLRAEAADLAPGGTWLIAWLDYAIVIDAVVAGRPLRQPIDPQWLQELRLFGERGEWRLWRGPVAFAGRRRLDGDGGEIEALDDDQSLWGTRATSDDLGGSVLSEGRGISFRMPVGISNDDLPLRLTVRQYLSPDEDGMTGVVDSRLVRLSTWHGTPVSLPAGNKKEG